MRGPFTGFFELSATIEAVSGMLPLLPFLNIFAQRPLKTDVVAGLVQPICQALPLPFPNQRLVTHFDSGLATDLVSSQQSRADESF